MNLGRGVSFFLILFFALGAGSAADVAVAPKSADPKSKAVQACINRLGSPICQKLEGKPGLLKPEQCAANVNMENTSVLSTFGNCAAGGAFSLWDLAKFVWEAVKFLAKAPFQAVGGVYNYLTDSDTRASTHESLKSAMETSADYLQSIYPYIAIEMQKAYDGVTGPMSLSPPTRAYAAMNAMGGKLIGSLLSAAEKIISAKVEELNCFDNNTRAQMICKFAGDIFLPPAAFFGLLKYGVKGLKEMPALMNKLNESLKVGQNSHRTQAAEEVLGKKLSPEQAKAIEEAHKVGMGQPGLDGTPAKIGNYTKPQIEEKAKILAEGGFKVEDRRKLIEEGIAGEAGNKTPYVSFMDRGQRRAAQVLDETADAYKVRMLGSDGKPVEKWIRKDELIGMRDSDNAALAFERTGDSRVDRVRESAVQGDFKEADRFISYSDGSASGRASARVVGVSKDTGAVIVDDITNSGFVRRELSTKELLTAKTSDTAKKNYDYVAQNVKAKPIPGVEAVRPTEFVKNQFKDQLYHSDDRIRAAGRLAYEERFNVPTSPDLTNIARSEGRIIEHRASQGAKLKEGTYTYVITTDGRMITGKVEDSFEFGVKHSNLARGKKVVSAGEIKVNRDGSYSFNNESGSYAAELIKQRAVTSAELEKRTKESMKVYLGDRGQFEKRILLPEREPTRQNLIRYCQTRGFLQFNLEACCKVVGIGCN